VLKFVIQEFAVIAAFSPEIRPFLKKAMCRISGEI